MTGEGHAIRAADVSRIGLAARVLSLASFEKVDTMLGEVEVVERVLMTDEPIGCMVQKRVTQL
jgi:hypothetical protein